MKTYLLLLICSASLLMGATDAETLFKKQCAACHGINADKKALNTSRMINTLDKEEIVNALVGYKEGNSGGKFKKVKQRLATALSEDDMHALADYIHTLHQQN